MAAYTPSPTFFGLEADWPARAAGAAPLHVGKPGYRPGLDPDGNGVEGFCDVFANSTETYEFLASPGCGALVAFGGQEEPARFALQPRPDAHLRLAVDRGYVQMVHPVGEQEVQGLVRDPLGDLRERRPTEDHPGALVAGAAELG